jgi:hypothetical protein
MDERIWDIYDYGLNNKWEAILEMIRNEGKVYMKRLFK